MLSRAGHYLLSIVTVVLFYWIIGLCMPFSSIHVIGEGEMAARNSLRKQLQDWPRLHFLTRTDRIVSALQQNPWVDKVSAFKSFDGSLRIRMSYKQPVMRSIGGRYLMDSRGQLLMTHVTDDLLRLPVFDGQQTMIRQAHQLWLRLDHWQARLMVMTHHPFSGWELLFDNKVTVRLGTKKLTDRLDLFLKVAKHWSLEQSVEAQVFDMRYNHSFTHKKLSA